MDSREQRAVENFIKNMMNANAIDGYIAEITSDREFHDRLEDNRSKFRRGQYPSWHRGVNTTIGMALYALCRQKKPDTVVETGVASGVSSSYILSALEQNGNGLLYSIDLPGGSESQSGWMIPDYLRHRWHLTLGKTSEKLAPLLKNIGEINIFLHDSEHSYQNMLREFQTAWVSLKTGGLLLSHNIDVNSAFSDFCKSVGRKGYLLSNLGGVAKA